MSGIAGIIRFDDAPVEPGLVRQMTAAMAHRGPDGIDHWVHDSVALGQCRFCTTTESLQETQPLANEDASLVLVMDGRVDNWVELREELLKRRAILRDGSDAELVLRAYENFGSKCLAHIDGDFAFVIWDVRRRTAFCARDRLASRPLNYHWDGRALVFASELHAILLLPWVKQELNEGMLADYLSMDWCSREETPWKGIRRLAAAHRMEVGRNGVRAEEYWRPELHSPLRYRSDGEYAEHYLELFKDRIRRLSRSHRTLGIEVSGGMDSSAICAVAEGMRRGKGLLAPDLAAYTLAYDDDPDFNDLSYARAVGAHLDVPVHEVNPGKKPIAWFLDWAREFKEFPGYPNTTEDLWRLAREHGCRTVLVGVGGNEWTDGSRAYYAEELAAGHWRNLYRCLQNDSRAFGALTASWWLARYGAALLLPRGTRAKLRQGIAAWHSNKSHSEDWLLPSVRSMASHRLQKVSVLNDGIRFGRVGQRMQHAVLTDAFLTLGREDEERLAAHAGVELRRPFWSAAMVQFAFSTPERVRLKGASDRYLHRRAMAGLLPSAVLDRKVQADHMIAFRRHGRELMDALSGASLQQWHRWVFSEKIAEKYSQFGNKIHFGQPEWLLWSVFGCSALAASAQ